MTDAEYAALCIHGPGSPDRCGHPDCIGWRLYKPSTAPDQRAVTEVPKELRQRQLIRALWFTIGEMQENGQEAGQPVPTWRIDETLGAVLSEALGETPAVADGPGSDG